MKKKCLKAFVESCNPTKLLETVQDFDKAEREVKTATENERTPQRVKETNDQTSMPG